MIEVWAFVGIIFYLVVCSATIGAAVSSGMLTPIRITAQTLPIITLSKLSGAVLVTITWPSFMVLLICVALTLFFTVHLHQAASTYRSGMKDNTSKLRIEAIMVVINLSYLVLIITSIFLSGYVAGL